MKYYKKIILFLELWIYLPLFSFNHMMEHVQLNYKATITKKITIIGCGYVGLVSGAALAYLGHQVTCVDHLTDKIEQLNKQKLPLFEPHLLDLIQQEMASNKLIFTHEINKAIQDSDIIIIAVGTPSDLHGNADLSYIQAAIETIGNNLNTYKVICLKSTVPPGTATQIKQQFQEHINEKRCDIVSNPEFLREGCALKDFFQLNPIVLGFDSQRALHIMEDIYEPLINNGTPLIKTNSVSAETIKYAWNCFSSIKINYVNELAQFCNACNADIETVIEGASFSDIILPIRTIKPGPGVGGSCLPKDTAAFIHIAKKYGVDVDTVCATISSNKKHIAKIISTIYDAMNHSVEEKTISILGLSFKANTDDIRNSPAIPIINHLLKDNAHIQAYDPQAMNNMKEVIPNITYCDSLEVAISNADLIVILTEWEEFKAINWNYFQHKKPIVFDTRNMYNPKKLKDFTLLNLGKYNDREKKSIFNSSLQSWYINALFSR